MDDRKDCRGISKMAATEERVDPSSSTGESSSKIAPWASGEHLRYVEKEVLIPKIVRERAKAKCDDLVKGELFCCN